MKHAKLALLPVEFNALRVILNPSGPSSTATCALQAASLAFTVTETHHDVSFASIRVNRAWTKRTSVLHALQPM
jgi:hypothetical protein